MTEQKIKVLVVEDEILLVKNISKKIMAAASDFIVVGEAFNGKEALELIEQFHPDIVFTDIRMPIMDGLELARILHEEYPNIFTVIVSGYDDFEYARTVLSYQVFDYLLKPLQKDALEKLIFNLKKCVLKKKEEHLYSLLYRQIHGNPSVQDSKNLLELKTFHFTLLLICFGNLHSRQFSHIENTELQNNPDSSFWNILFDDAPFSFFNFWIFPNQYSNMKLTVIANASVEPAEIAGYLHCVLTKQQNLDVQINLAYSTQSIYYSDLHPSTCALQKTLVSSLVIGTSTIFAVPSSVSLLPPAVLTGNLINYVQTIISSNNTPGLQSAITNIFSEWNAKRYPQQWIEKVLVQLLAIFQQNLFFSEIEYEKMYEKVFIILETEQSLLVSSKKIADELQYWMVLYQSLPSEIEDTIEELDMFIHTHYTEPISLSELAEKYHFNQSYLTRIFKKQKGASPLKLINTLRINDAKNLLMDPDLSVKEISEMLGFSNQHYFSRIFKDFTDFSPKDYRSQ